MFIKLTLSPESREIWIRAIDVKSIERAPADAKGGISLETIVATTLITSQGPFAYKVKESPADIAGAVADVLRDIPKKSLDPAQR